MDITEIGNRKLSYYITRTIKESNDSLQWKFPIQDPFDL